MSVITEGVSISHESCVEGNQVEYVGNDQDFHTAASFAKVEREPKAAAASSPSESTSWCESVLRKSR